MKKEERLPDVLFFSKQASNCMANRSSELHICMDADMQGVSFKDMPADVAMDNKAVYRNIVQLWHSATEKPHCIGSLLCWCRNGMFFVHEHYSHDDENWNLFISTNDIKRYCYLANLQPDCFDQ